MHERLRQLIRELVGRNSSESGKIDRDSLSRKVVANYVINPVGAGQRAGSGLDRKFGTQNGRSRNHVVRRKVIEDAGREKNVLAHLRARARQAGGKSVAVSYAEPDSAQNAGHQ